MTQPKPTIKALPIDQASWVHSIQSGWNWAYRVVSPFNPDNEITGAMAGTKEVVMQRAKELGKKIMRDGKGLHPFARPIKNSLSGKKENTDFNRFPG